jgi:hypothetical protein
MFRRIVIKKMKYTVFQCVTLLQIIIAYIFTQHSIKKIYIYNFYTLLNTWRYVSTSVCHPEASFFGKYTWRIKYIFQTLAWR